MPEFIHNINEDIESPLDAAHQIQRLCVEVTKLRRAGNYNQIKTLYMRSINSGLISPIALDASVEDRNELEIGLLCRFYIAFREVGLVDKERSNQS